MPTENQYVPFRLIHMQCCHTLICWVNARRPSYCPECGENIFRLIAKDRWEEQYSPAWLTIELPDQAVFSTNIFSDRSDYKLRNDTVQDAPDQDGGKTETTP